MAIRNADLDASQQRDYLTWVSGYGASGLGIGVGITQIIAGPMPYPYILQSVAAISAGTSGAPLLVPLIGRPMKGGYTMIAVSISSLVVANTASFLVGSTGSLVYSGLAPVGSTLLFGQMGDLLIVTTAGANTACTQLMVQMVVKRTQDIVTMDGV